MLSSTWAIRPSLSLDTVTGSGCRSYYFLLSHRDTLKETLPVCKITQEVLIVFAVTEVDLHVDDVG